MKIGKPLRLLKVEPLTLPVPISRPVPEAARPGRPEETTSPASPAVAPRP